MTNVALPNKSVDASPTYFYGESSAGEVIKTLTSAYLTLTGAQAMSNKTLTAPVFSGSITGTYTLAGTPTITSPTITSPTINSGTFTGTFDGLLDLRRGISTSNQTFFKILPTDYGVGKPGIHFDKAATATTWNLVLWDSASTAGTINVQAGNFQWNGSQLIDAGSTQTITGAKTFNNGTTYFTGAGTVGLEIGRTDGVAGFALLDFHTGATFVDYDSRFQMSGGTGSNGGGTINALAAAFQWNGSQLIDAASAQTITGQKTISRGTATGTEAYIMFQPTDWGTGKPRLQLDKGGTAAYWSFSLWDGTNYAGTINFNATTALTWNSVQLADISTSQTLTNKSLSDSTTFFVDNSDTTKKLQLQISSITTGTTRTWTVPDVSDTFVGTTAAQTLTNKTLGAGTSLGIVTANTTTAYTIDYTAGYMWDLTLTGNCTYTFPTPTLGRIIHLMQKQDGTGSRTVTWPATVKWPGGTAPTITSTASRADIFEFWANGTVWYGRVLAQNYVIS